jgi:erythromycin esterase
MRAYNQQHTTKIRYVGIDMQDPTPNLLRLESFATQRADTMLRRQVRNLRTAYSATGPASAADAGQRLVRLADELVQHLQAVAAPATMQQHGQVLRQWAELSFWGRDQAMTTNVAWLLRQEPAAKVVLWAHNTHLRRDEDQPWLGRYLARQLGSAYVAIGFATCHGTASVFNDGPARTLVLAPPISGSFETWLDQAAAPTYFLALRSTALVDKWLTTRHKFRQIGEREGPRGAKGQFIWYAPLPKAFDGLFYLHETSASQPYRATHPAR